MTKKPPFESRKNKVIRKLKDVEALVITDPVNLYYLTGLSLSTGRLILPKKTPPFLVVDGRYFEAAKLRSPYEVRCEKEIDQDLFKRFKRVGFLADRVRFDLYQIWEQTGVELVPLKDLMEDVRAIKDKEEIKKIEDASLLTAEGINFLMGELVEGITEKEVANKLEIFWLHRGGEKLAFNPIVAFGENTSKPHHIPGKRALIEGDLVQFDVGVVKWGYHSDMSRVIPFGTPKKSLQGIIPIVLEAKKRAEALLKPGRTLWELDQAARGYITKMGYGKQFVHSLGHGVGLEVHEHPKIPRIKDKRRVLKEGMVLTIEPGIYLNGVGGVRIEDTILITHDGYRILGGAC